MSAAARTPKIPLDLRTTLGLADPDLPGWEKVRSAVMVDLRRILPIAWAIHLLSAAALGSVVWRAIPHWQVLLWLSAMFALVAFGIVMRPRLTEDHPRLEGLKACGHALVGGALWAVPPLFFAGEGGVEQQIAVCFILGGIVASAPITLWAVPLTMVGFVLPIALGLTAMMARTGSTVLTALPALYALTLLGAGIAICRAALRHRWAETALDDESEIVSLLLREFEANQADWLWEIDIRKRLVGVTPRLAQAFDQPADRLRGRSLLALLAQGFGGHCGYPSELRMLLDLLDSRQSFRDHALPVMIGAEQRWWQLSATPRHDAGGRFTGFRGVASDISEQRRSLERIDRLARADGLTEIDNRLAFTEKLRAALDEAVAGGRPCALMLIDLDRFKPVNDTYGHPVGDKLLRAAAGRLAGLVDPGDACGRLGGDEFALLVADARELDRVDAIGRRVLRALTRPYEIDGHRLQVGASIGIARAPRDGTLVETLMGNADLALYRVKRGGRGACLHFAPELLERAERRLEIEQALRHAVERDQMRLAYQPVVSVVDGRLQAFEALLRWCHPDMGEIAPAEFVPIAGAAGLMVPIGEWVLLAACREAVRWPEAIGVSINLSADQVRDPGLPAAIRATLAVTGLQPHRLSLEIAETTLLDDDDGGSEGRDVLDGAVERLRATGARLVLDDFGAGFGCIRQARFSTIKIARDMFQGDGGSDPENLALVRALVTMADTLGLLTVAKGAETTSQQALVRQLGCRQVQGNASGQAGSAEEAHARAWVREEGRRNVA